MNSKLDVIIPTYNRPRLLDRCVRSALALDVPGLRVVVINDGSTTREEIDDGTVQDTSSVMARFSDARLVYEKIQQNSGLGVVFETYAKRLMGSQYMTVINDDDVFIDGEPIKQALNKLDSDPEIALVQISLIRRSDDRQIDDVIDLPYQTMSGKDFMRAYIDGDPIKHTTMYGIFRTENVARTGALVSLRLRDYGLEDAFGIDTDFLFRMATTGKAAFINQPHVLRRETEGLTDRYPTSFAYCYYQYILRAISYLREHDFIEPSYVRKFIAWWMKVMLMSFSASLTMQKSEKGDERVRRHLGYPLHLYILKQFLRFRIWPDKESRDLYMLTLRNVLGNRS